MKWIALIAIALAACATQRNYETAGPRHAGSATPLTAPVPKDTIRIVSFNIEYAYHIDSAIVALQERELRDADILLLQEMDAEGTRRIAAAMRMGYVYYPATRHLRTGRDFGNAVLSRWPIVADEKILLPHLAMFGDSRRAATAATLRVGETDIRVYSAHLGTVANVTTAERRNQMQVIVDDAKRFDRVVIGGDLNDPLIAAVAFEQGYAWPTRKGPRTGPVGRLDHILLKGIASALEGGSGTLLDNHQSSDHRPIWALAILR